MKRRLILKTFITLIKMTDKGRTEIAGSLERGEIVKGFMEKQGVTRPQYFMTLGEYDFVFIFKAPSEIAMAQVLLEIGRLGAIETKTMICVGEDDYTELLEGLSK
jgi:uncharacterized protein with GYD domain